MEWVYDRSQKDVDRAIELNTKYVSGVITEEEKEEWAAGLKGALNAVDLNRIESNIATIAAYVAASVKTRAWTAADIPRESDFLRIRNNVQSIKDAWIGLSSTPEIPAQPLNTYLKWNDIERILYDIYFVYERTVKSYDYCGEELFAGEGIGVI